MKKEFLPNWAGLSNKSQTMLFGGSGDGGTYTNPGGSENPPDLGPEIEDPETSNIFIG